MEILILGTRGIPARHGGFETFAQDLSLYLVNRGHKVTVYCQTAGDGDPAEDVWKGVHRVLIPSSEGPMGTILFDWKAANDASTKRGVVLTLGYNTALFSVLYRLRHVPCVMNMDGIEWKREKWSMLERAWLWCNEQAGSALSNHLVADHPEIARYLQKRTPARKITCIPYGADEVLSAPAEPLASLGLNSKEYYLLIARPEPENSILEIVRGFSSPDIQAPLVILGDYTAKRGPYQQLVQHEAGSNVVFLGAIYDRTVLRSLRYHAKAYVHGHRVGGTNPSLIESLAAGNAVIAHDNCFTRWVAGSSARFFKGPQDLAEIVRSLERQPEQFAAMEIGSRLRYREEFTQEKILGAYEQMLLRIAEGDTRSRSRAS